MGIRVKGFGMLGNVINAGSMIAEGVSAVKQAGNTDGQPPEQKPVKKKGSVGGLIFLILIGFALIGFGFLMYKSSTATADWTKIEGKVIDYEEDYSSSSDNYMYKPICSYTVDDEDYTVTSSSSSSISPSIGDSCAVLYNPDDPSKAKVDGGAVGTLLMFGLPVLGVILIVVGIVGFILSKKKKNDDTVPPTPEPAPVPTAQPTVSAPVAPAPTAPSGDTLEAALAALPPSQPAPVAPTPAPVAPATPTLAPTMPTSAPVAPTATPTPTPQPVQPTPPTQPPSDFAGDLQNLQNKP